MLRTLDIVMIGALIATAGYTFKIKHDAEQSVARVEKLETRIRLEKEAIDILKADWSLLTSPDRLARLVERHAGELQIEPLAPAQIGAIADAPEPPPVLPPIDSEHAAAAAADEVTTGGIDPERLEEGAASQ